MGTPGVLGPTGSQVSAPFTLTHTYKVAFCPLDRQAVEAAKDTVRRARQRHTAAIVRLSRGTAAAGPACRLACFAISRVSSWLLYRMHVSLYM